MSSTLFDNIYVSNKFSINASLIATNAILDTFVYPTVDGTIGQAITTNGAKSFSLTSLNKPTGPTGPTFSPSGATGSTGAIGTTGSIGSVGSTGLGINGTSGPTGVSLGMYPITVETLNIAGNISISKELTLFNTYKNYSLNSSSLSNFLLPKPNNSSIYKQLSLVNKLSGNVEVNASVGTFNIDYNNSNPSPIFVSNSSTWIQYTNPWYVTKQQSQKLVGTGNTGASKQGWAVSISANGNTLATSGFADNTNAGATWIFTRTGYGSAAVWSQQGSKLVGSGATGAANQGNSISLSADGNTLAVGGYSDNTNQGATWIFTRISGSSSWSQQGGKIIGTGNTGAAQQGYAVCLSGDGNTLASSGWTDNTNQGAVWIFTRTSGVWSQQGSKLIGTGNTGAAQQGSYLSLSADGNTLAVGSSNDNSSNGAVWIFTRINNTWAQQAKIIGSGNSGASNVRGVSLSSDGNTLARGGIADASFVGTAWIFTRSGGLGTTATWTQQGNKLAATGLTGAAALGSYVSLSADGNTLAVGADGDNTNQGATVLYTRNNTVWTQQGLRLVGSGNTGAAAQGVAVDLNTDGNTLVVGGYSDNTNVGATWVFS